MAAPEVPEPYQWIMYLAGGIAAIYAALRGITSGEKAADRSTNPDVIVQGGSFVDMRPIRELNTNLEHLVNHTAANAIATRQMADTLEEIRKLMKMGADEDKAEELINLAMLRLQMKEKSK
jgi:hypothetical protein